MGTMAENNFSLEPLHIGNVTDYHIHPDYSIDAKGSVEDYCRAAVERNLVEICFTTHFDSNPRGDGKANFIRVNGENRPATIENLAPYVEDVRKVSEDYLSLGLMVKLGVEFGWYSGCEEVASKLRRQYDLDYFLVGIHELGDECFCCRSSYERCFSKYSVEQAVKDYVQQVIDAAKSKLFDTVAHLDYIRKYGERVYGPTINEEFRHYTSDIFRALITTGTKLEVNTAGRRAGFESWYPRTEIINDARRAGVEVAYLGSDAHAPEHVGFDFESAAALVPAAVGGCDD